MFSNYHDSTVPALSEGWSDNLEPLSQTKERTRDDLRRILSLPVALDAMVALTRAMNTVAALSATTVSTVEAALAEYKQLEASRTAIQQRATWDGSAPLKKADVVEYDTSVLADPNAIAAQTQGINARMGQLEHEIRVALNLSISGHGSARMYRS